MPREEECDTMLSLDKECNTTLCEADLSRQEECDTMMGLDKECNTTLCEADLCPDKRSVTQCWAWIRSAMLPYVEPGW